MATFVHFMVPADDLQRAKRFYAELFGWTIEKTPGPFEYYDVKTRDEHGREGYAGGMGQRAPGQQGIINYVGVPSVDEHLKKIEALGGTVVQPKMPVPGFGYLAVCLDTEHNTFGLWEDDPDASV